MRKPRTSPERVSVAACGCVRPVTEQDTRKPDTMCTVCCADYPQTGMQTRPAFAVWGPGYRVCTRCRAAGREARRQAEQPAASSGEATPPIHRVTPPRLRGEPAREATCLTHGDPLVCLACEADEDARPEWRQRNAHRCSGCGHRWDGPLNGAELCGDCWRKAQPVVQSASGAANPQEFAAVRSAWQPTGGEATRPAAAALTEQIANFVERNDGVKLSPDALAFIEELLEGR